MTSSSYEPVLDRLRKAIRKTGAIREAGPDAPLAVTGRLAQTICDQIRKRHPETADLLIEDLRTLASAEECDLLLQGRGFTYFHVIQYLYAFAAAHGHRKNPDGFCVEIGRLGGGLYINPETDVLSLTQLLIAALPDECDGDNIGLLVEALAPMMLDKIFPGGLFQIHSHSAGIGRLSLTLAYADPDRVAVELARLDLADDAGRFFLTMALQIQGTVQLGLRTFSRRLRDVRIAPALERATDAHRETARLACRHTWAVTWEPGVHLRRVRDPEHLLTQVRTIYDTLHRRDLEYFQERIKTLEMRVQALEGGFHNLIGDSPQMRRVYDIISQIADTDLTVLVRGESGTGKELVARALHERSARTDRPFLAINCAAFSETLLESELFGHEKGAFTGADRTKPGRFERAHGGTLFLDEAGDIPLPTQVKLLRVLETREFERVGGTETRTADVRIIAATNRDLETLIAEGAFREDFYYRLNVLPLHLPALRERREDIPRLARHMLEEIAARTGKSSAALSRGALDRLLSHTWPGNVRELRHVLERATAVYARGGAITADHIDQALGLQSSRLSAPMLNVRQRELIDLIHASGGACTVDDLLARTGVLSEGMGRSRRTLQNDLRKLTGMNYLTWQKRGSARRYLLTPRGIEIAGT